MAPSMLRRAIEAVKDQARIGLAKVGGGNSIADLEVAIVKATRHQETPPEERHICEILNLTTYSPAMVTACVTTIARRLNRTKNWVVALKALMLIHRLLCGGDRSYEDEIFFSTRRGSRFLNMSDFRDSSGKSDGWDYSAFVRTYALYLDELLELRMPGRRSKRRCGCAYQGEEGDGSQGAAAATTPIREMEIESIFSRIHRLKQLLGRFLACRPTGAAKHNRVVAVALYPIVKENFQICNEITEIMATLVDRFMRLEVPKMVRVYEVFCGVSKQYDELDAFYNWCKNIGIMRSSEFPDVKKIPQTRLDLMDDYIRQKCAMLRARSSDPKPISKPVEEDKKEEDLFSVKTLPPPPPPQAAAQKIAEKTEKPKGEKKLETDLLINLCEDAEISTQEQENKLALALLDCGPSTTAPQPWESFKENWETALVQSVSHLPNEKANLPNGFDVMTLDGLYQQGAMTQAVGLMGSATSIVAGRPAVLALRPPGGNGGGGDPFAASVAVPAPLYGQMADMRKKQILLVEEQIAWQQYYPPSLPPYFAHS